MPTVIGRSTCKKDGQKRPRPARGVREGLSWMRGNSHVQFLGGGEVAILPCYPGRIPGNQGEQGENGHCG